MAVSSEYVVAAIDIGSTYSGFAFSFKHDYQKDPTQISTKQWTAGMGNLMSLKTPTSILFNSDGEFDSFGYEAEENITEKQLDDPEVAKTWYFFQRFKMKLYEHVRIRRDLTLQSVNGKTMPAIKVFSASIRYLVDQLLIECSKQATGIKMDDITWVLTVPAIWSDTAKKFMREAAEKAGIKSTHLRLALEPEAAALYVRHIPFAKPEQEPSNYDSMPYMMSSATVSETVPVKRHSVRTIAPKKRHDFEPLEEDTYEYGIEEVAREIQHNTVEIPPQTEMFATEFDEMKLATETTRQSGMLIKLEANAKYIVVDAGGGTVDIAVHQLTDDDRVREIHMANGGDWGGTKVDAAFEDFLVEIVSPEPGEPSQGRQISGKEIFADFCQNFVDDHLELMRDFETKKRAITKSMKGKITIRFPPTLEETFTKLNPDSGLQQIDKSKFSGSVRRANDKIRIDSTVAFSFFDKPIQHIVAHLSQLMRQPNVKDVQTILMVGGFSESPLLISAIRESFTAQVVVPRDAGLSVLKGAVIFGHDQSLFKERISKYTYGVKCEGPYDEKLHPPKFKHTDTKGINWCHNLFDVHVRIGEVIRTGEPQSVRSYLPSRFIKNGIFNFPVYATKKVNPMFVVEPEKDIEKIGQVTISIPPKDLDYEEEILVSLTFSGTEIEATAEYAKTRQKEHSYIASID